MPTSKKRKVKSAEELSNEELALIGIDYVNKKDAMKELDSQCKKIRKPLEEYVVSSGKVLDSGSRIAVVSHSDVDVHLKHTLRVSSILLPEAMDVLEAEGLSECIEEVKIVREDVIERLHSEGTISDKVLSKLYAPKESYAFSVEIKERFKDAPET